MPKSFPGKRRRTLCGQVDPYVVSIMRSVEFIREARVLLEFQFFFLAVVHLLVSVEKVVSEMVALDVMVFGAVVFFLT